MSESPSAERHHELLKEYVIPNMGDYTAVGGVPSSILDRLDKHKALSPEDKAFIRDKGLFDLCEFVKRLEETKRQDFHYLRASHARSPQRRKMLWAKYGIGFIESAHMRQMIDILERVEVGARVADADVLWLVTNDYRTYELKRAIHEIEAKYFREVFEKTNDPWAAVNASSNFRKAESPLAVQRGATLDALDSEVRGILRRLNDVRRSTLADHLLKADPVRYAWLAPKKTGKRSEKRDV